MTARGRFRVRVPTAQGGRESIGIFETVEEAEHHRAAAIEILYEETSLSEGMTLMSFAEVWLSERESGKIRNRRGLIVRDTRNDRSRWNHHIGKDQIAGLELRAIRRRHVESFLERLLERGVIGQTLRNVFYVLRGVLRAAYRRELIRSNPTLEVLIPGQTRTEDPWTYLTLEEQRALVSAIDGPERHLVNLAIWTGLRAGELAALLDADVHVEGPRPHITVRYGSPPTAKKKAAPTKTGKIRTVFLFGEGLAAARAWLEERAEFVSENPSGIFAPRACGTYRAKWHILASRVWTAAKRKAGIVRRLRWHDLRHTCASSLLSGCWGRRWSLVEVKDLLGHAEIATTERYSHLHESALESAARETNAFFAKLDPPPPPLPRAEAMEALPPVEAAAAIVTAPIELARAVVRAAWVRGRRARKASNWPRIGHGNRKHMESFMEVEARSGFVNRRSPVQARKAAPSSSQQIAHLLEEARGRLVATSRALREVSAAGRPQAAGRLATLLATLTLRVDALERDDGPCPAQLLAVDVLEGGEFALGRALDLAELVDPAPTAPSLPIEVAS